jgi:hypothetical protein
MAGPSPDGAEHKVHGHQGGLTLDQLDEDEESREEMEEDRREGKDPSFSPLHGKHHHELRVFKEGDFLTNIHGFRDFCLDHPRYCKPEELWADLTSDCEIDVHDFIEGISLLLPQFDPTVGEGYAKRKKYSGRESESMICI